MAAKSNKGLTDDEIADVIRNRLDDSIGGTNNALKTTRIRALKFYMGKEPRPLHAGNSSFVSRDVFDAVEGRKAALLEAFTGNVRPVRFAPTGPDDVQAAEQATVYTDYVIFRQNDGYNVMHDVIHDGLIARNGIVQVSWKRDVQNVTYQMSNQTQEAVIAFISQHQDALVDWDVVAEHAEDGTVDVEVTLREDKSRVCIENVPPEEFGVSNHALSLDDSNIVWRCQIRSIEELRQQGLYDEAKLDELEDAESSVMDDWETAERFIGVDNAAPDTSMSDQGRKMVKVHDCYAKIDVEGEGQTSIWHVVYSEGIVLMKEKVSRHPFHAFIPMRVPHRFYGDDFAGSVIPVQIANTLLTRTVIDHALITTNPRYMVLRGGLTNPRELIENRLGGLVNVTRPDALAPLPNPALSPMVFSTMEKMDAIKQTVTGTSDLQQGLSKDALSNQNSADLVQAMATVGLTRAKIMARNFADFMRGLFIAVYQLVIENETSHKQLEVDGQWTQIDPVQWSERTLVSVEFALGYGEADKAASELFQYDQYMAADPSMASYYTAAERYNVWTDIMKLKHRYDVNRYIKNPATVPPPSPSQQQVLEAQLQQRDMNVKEQTAQAHMIKAIASAQATQGKMATADQNNALKVEQATLRRQQFEHQAGVDAAEIALQAHATRQTAVDKPVNVMPK